jgi:hypothetical protein
MITVELSFRRVSFHLRQAERILAHGKLAYTEIQRKRKK